MGLKTKVFKNTVFQIAGRSLTILISLLTTAVLTRTLGVETFGDYVFITSIVLLFVGLTDFGTITIGVREASVSLEKKEKIFGSVLSLRIIISLFIFIAFNLLIYFLPQFAGLREPSLIASFVILFLILRTTMQAVLQVFLRLDLASFLEVIASLLALLFIGSFLLLGIKINLFWLMIFWSVSALASGIAGLYYVKKLISFKLNFNKDDLFKIFKQASPLGVYLLVYAVYDRGIDSFFLKTFVNSEAVGFYGLAYKIHGNLIFGAAFLMNSLFPIISALKNDEERLKLIFKKAFSVLFFFGLLSLFLGTLFAPLIIRIISGAKFVLSVNILRILLFATFFSFLNHLNGYLLISLNEQKKLLVFSLFSLILNLVLNTIFIPRYSFWAAAAVTVLTEGLIFVLTSVYLKRKYQLTISGQELKNNLFLFLKKRKSFFDF
ncbi:hypothetical protein COS55_03590 [Candidatus Shapirobacteria bacterium CG03_land_8_20_14_0_80_40_19]|uniref:Uncharacterized protein n=2 Tax=Candidatus Shapironibacteriota TaxID=1752721 RepID=A0A2M7BBF6_9BACT|nr:MAG: hypothetical protein COS55_03590 [Candidatus Shapirobacteria bacterium CG03_land_8_20_14_0_80_40_19]PJC28563.1 MAG: hypothetical protein CO053_04045 [Candidatus Shapirobacteria bacterium CG_4_9_14_0_2_um_filter_40_11]